MAHEASNCKDFIMNNKSKFGITENNLRTEYLDICAQNVRCIASRQISANIPLPSMSGFINSCTGLIDTASGIDTRFSSLRITCAKEELVRCETNHPGVRVVIKGQVIVRTRPCNSRYAPSYMAIPVELVSEIIRDFYSTKTGNRVDLKEELPYIDGSCMVINLRCKICRENGQNGSRYIAHIQGSVVDKLWKNENIWVEGIRPYPAPSLTVCEKFDREFCNANDCSDGEYVSLSSQRDRCNNECDCDCNGEDEQNDFPPEPCYPDDGCDCGCNDGRGQNGGCDNHDPCYPNDDCGCDDHDHCHDDDCGCNDPCYQDDDCGCNDPCYQDDDCGCNDPCRPPRDRGCDRNNGRNRPKRHHHDDCDFDVLYQDN